MKLQDKRRVYEIHSGMYEDTIWIQLGDKIIYLHPDTVRRFAEGLIEDAHALAQEIQPEVTP